MTLAGSTGITVSASMSLPAANLSWTNTGTLTFAATTSQTITSNAVTIASPITFSGTGGTWALQDALTSTGSAVTLSAGTLNLNGYTLTCPTFVSNVSVARTIAYGSTGIINITGTGTVWNTSTLTNFSYTGTSNVRLTNAGSTAITITPGSATAAQAQNFAITAGTYALTISAGSNINNLDFTGFSGSFTLGGTVTLYGNLTLSSTTTSTLVANSLTFGGTSVTQTLTTADKNIGCSVNINGSANTVRLVGTLTQTSTRAFTLTSGTLDINSQTTSVGILTIVTGTKAITNGTINAVSVTHTSGAIAVTSTATIVTTGTYTFTAGSIDIGNSAVLSVGAFSSANTGTRSISYNTSGELRLTGTGTVWDTGTVTNFSYTGTSNIRLTNSGSTAITITAGSMSAAQAQNFAITAGTYTLTTTTSGAMNNLDFTGFSGTYAQAATSISVFGNLVYSATMTTSTTAGSGFIIMAATSGTDTITTNGITVNNNIRFNGVGGTFQLADNFTQGTTSYFNIQNGTVDFNNVIYSIGVLEFTSGTNSYINYGGTLNPASVIHTSGTVNTGTGALIVTTGSYTFTAGTLNINNGVTLSVRSFSSVNTNTRVIAFGTGNITTTGSGTMWNVTAATGFSYTGTPTVRINNNTATSGSINNTATAASAVNFNIVSGTYTLTISTAGSFNDIDFTGFAGTMSFGSTNITMYGNLTLATGMTTTGTASQTHITWAHTTGTEIITSNGITSNFGIRVNGTGGTLRFADTFNQGSTQVFILTAGTFDLNSQSVTAGIFNINTGTHAITNGTLNCASATHSSGDLSIGTGYNVICSGAYTFVLGSITINNDVNLSVGSFSSANTNTRSIAFGAAGTITTTGTINVWNVTGVSGFSFTGTSKIIVNNNTSTAVNVTNTATAASAMSFAFINGTYALNLVSGNSFRDLNFTGFTGSIDFSTNTHTMYGNLTLGSGMTTSATANTNTLAWVSTSGTRTITSNGVTANFGISLSGAGQTLQLADAFIQGSTQRFSYTNGTFDMAGYSAALGVFTITTGTHALLNGTATCATVTHTSGNLAVGSGYLLACSGTYTLTNGTITINDNVTLTMFAFSSNNSNAGRSIAFGTSGLVEITGKSTTVWLVNPAGFTYTGTSLVRLTATGTGTTTTINPGTGSATISFNFEVTAGSYPITTPLGAGFKSLNFTGYSGAWTNTTGANLYGDLIISSGMTFGVTFGTISFSSGTYNAVLTSNGKNFPSSVTLSNTGSVTLTDNYSGSTSLVRDTSGSIVANANVSASNITINGNANLGSGIWSVGGSWTTGASSVITPGTSTIRMGSASTKTFAGAGKTYYNLEQNDTGTLIITGSNSFNDITVTPSLGASTITLTSGTTQTVTNFTLSGTAGNLVTLNSSTPGSPATLSKSTGTVSVSYLNIVDSTATGGATWQAYTSNGNVDGGGNSGWDFGAIIAAAIGAFFAFF
jgi:hypothetical protein